MSAPRFRAWCGLLCALALVSCRREDASPLAAHAGPTHREVAYRFAPVFVQKTSKRFGSGKEYEDWFVRMCFDHDASGFNNWENLADCKTKQCDLRGYVYCAVRETPKNYYLHYTYFHPSDPKLFFGHENDLEGAMVVVRKRAGAKLPDGNDIALVLVQAHNRWDYWEPKKFCMLETGQELKQALCGGPLPPNPGATHVVLVSQVGRNWWLDQGHGTEIPSKIDFGDRFITYRPWTDKGSTPKSGDAGTPNPSGSPATYPSPVTYALLPLSGDKDGDGELEADGPFGDESTPGPWDRRRDVRIFGKTKVPMGHGLQSDDGCKANMPWAWTGGGIPAGTFFLSPTKAEAYGKLKSEGVEEVEGESFTDAVGKDSDLKLFPYPSTPPPLDCDCKAMEQAFTAGSSSKDPLPQGTPCPPTASKVYTAADSESTERVFGSCEALRGWVPPEAETLVKAIQADGVCALQVPGDVLFRWPPSADDLRNGRGPALRLLTGERVVGVTLIARAVERPFSLGGFVLQAGVEYDESLRDVPWLKPVPLTREWREVTFRLVESQNVKAAAPLAAIALFPDLSQHFTNAENAFAAPGGPAWEVRRIELLYDRK